ncbi:hypothetical protein C8R47DRAFT_761798 [Mycena vitilis]|nr:hypothetical protein C8R47DRAFT_761798 [Mycena vitilis]
MLSALQAEHAFTREFPGFHKYPVMTLPNELVSEIFVHFLPTYPLCPPLTGTDSPQLLLHICRRWRHIALFTPGLWRAISLDGFETDVEQHETVQAWLGRSGDYPLSIQMDQYPFPEALQKLLGVIAAHSRRWEYIKLNISGEDFFTIEGDLPLLCHLNIYASGTPSHTMTLPDLPRLHTAIFSHFDYPDALLPWGQLTSLTLIGKLAHECTPALSHASGLRYCELLLYDRSGETTVKSDITLPYLETLVLAPWSKHMGFPNLYILSFIVPALRRLQGPGPALTHIPELISRSGCTLEEVWITGETDAVSNEQYRAAFPFIPKLSFNRKLAAWDPNEAKRLRMHPIGSLAQFGA